VLTADVAHRDLQISAQFAKRTSIYMFLFCILYLLAFPFLFLLPSPQMNRPTAVLPCFGRRPTLLRAAGHLCSGRHPTMLTSNRFRNPLPVRSRRQPPLLHAASIPCSAPPTSPALRLGLPCSARRRRPPLLRAPSPPGSHAPHRELRRLVFLAVPT
jgi:hypothetical protein